MGDSVPAALRRRVVQSFKLQGLTLQSGATSVLAEALEPYRDSGDLDEIVERIVEAVQQQPLSSSLIGREVSFAPPHSPLSHPSPSLRQF